MNKSRERERERERERDFVEHNLHLPALVSRSAISLNRCSTSFRNVEHFAFASYEELIKLLEIKN